MNAQATRQSTTPIAAAVLAVAATYAYFLLFAQFGFLEAARAVTGGEQGRFRLIMTVMGGAGIAASVGGAWVFALERARGLLLMGFAVCGSAALLTLIGETMGSMVAAALAVGAGAGFTTVVLAAALRPTLGAASLGKWSGLGTGLGYGFCNLPSVFAASPHTQAMLAMVIVALGAAATWFLYPTTRRGVEGAVEGGEDFRAAGVMRWTGLFFLLVGLDSAAFYIIQHTEPLKTGMWSGELRLWLNAEIHVVAAVIAGWALDRGLLGSLVATAAALLMVACGLVGEASGALASGVTVYVTAVSIYSVALVYYPARSGRAGIAAIVYAVAGWFGSAMGIGLAENVHRVPVGVSVAAGVLVVGLLAWRQRVARRALRVAALTGLLLAGGVAVPPVQAQQPELIARGRAVFIREGCIHCHSQYVRPETADEGRWGPLRPLESALNTPPPLLGNRRQGPDLQNVGNRRNREWNRLHLIAPSAITPGSRMPAYPQLFAPGRDDGDALLAYLEALGGDTLVDRNETTRQWTPAASVGDVNLVNAQAQFGRWCAGCHGSGARGDGPAAVYLSVKPRDLTTGAWVHLDRSEGPAAEQIALARLIKFGLPGSAMAGREYLDDATILSLANYIQHLRFPDSR